MPRRHGGAGATWRSGRHGRARPLRSEPAVGPGPGSGPGSGPGLGPGLGPGPGLVLVLQLAHLGVRAQDPLSRRSEIDERGDPVLDADHPAEAVHVVRDLVAHREVLGRRGDRGLEGTGGQIALRCTWLCHLDQYAPTRIRPSAAFRPQTLRRPPPGPPAGPRSAPMPQARIPPEPAVDVHPAGFDGTGTVPRNAHAGACGHARPDRHPVTVTCSPGDPELGVSRASFAYAAATVRE